MIDGNKNARKEARFASSYAGASGAWKLRCFDVDESSCDFRNSALKEIVVIWYATVHTLLARQLVSIVSFSLKYN